MKLKRSLSFDDVLLVPQFSDVRSRKTDIDLTHELGTLELKIPIISSPMDTITESHMAVAMDDQGGCGIIHRYNSIDVQCRHVESASAEAIVGAAIGVTGDFEERACALWEAGVSILCIDTAHGHHILMKAALHRLREVFGDAVHIMAGNVATLEGFNDLADWGADSIRVGIGGGSICSTRIQTGHGMPTLQSVMDCARSDRDACLIADGGIKNSGDIVKAIAAGADFVMLGSMLAGTDETPGDVIFDEGQRYKSYRGMASVEAQVDWRGHASSIEGVSSRVSCRGPVELIVQQLVSGIKSGLSYSGSRDIINLQSKAKFVEQTSSGAVESSTHIVRNK